MRNRKPAETLSKLVASLDDTRSMKLAIQQATHAALEELLQHYPDAAAEPLTFTTAHSGMVARTSLAHVVRQIEDAFALGYPVNISHNTGQGNYWLTISGPNDETLQYRPVTRNEQSTPSHLSAQLRAQTLLTTFLSGHEHETNAIFENIFTGSTWNREGMLRLIVIALMHADAPVSFDSDTLTVDEQTYRLVKTVRYPEPETPEEESKPLRPADEHMRMLATKLAAVLNTPAEEVYQQIIGATSGMQDVNEHGIFTKIKPLPPETQAALDRISGVTAYQPSWTVAATPPEVQQASEHLRTGDCTGFTTPSTLIPPPYEAVAQRAEDLPRTVSMPLEHLTGHSPLKLTPEQLREQRDGYLLRNIDILRQEPQKISPDEEDALRRAKELHLPPHTPEDLATALAEGPFSAFTTQRLQEPISGSNPTPDTPTDAPSLHSPSEPPAESVENRPNMVPNPRKSTSQLSGFLRNAEKKSVDPSHSAHTPVNPRHIVRAKSLDDEIAGASTGRPGASADFMTEDEVAGWAQQLSSAPASAATGPGEEFMGDREGWGPLRPIPVEGAALAGLLAAFDPPQASDVRQNLLIGLGGYKESGKDALADHLAHVHGFRVYGMSDAVHQTLLRINPWVSLEGTPEDLLIPLAKYTSHAPYANVTLVLGYHEAKRIPDYRRLLLTTGTNAGREYLGIDTWVNKADEKIRELRPKAPLVITGIRRRNELELILRHGGHTVWIDRPEKNLGDPHPTESELGPEDFQSVLVNDRDLASLSRRGNLLVGQLR